MVTTAHVLVEWEVVGKLLCGEKRQWVDGLVEAVQRGRENTVMSMERVNDLVRSVMSVDGRYEFLVLKNCLVRGVFGTRI